MSIEILYATEAGTRMMINITESPWKGRIDTEDGQLGLRWHQVVQDYPLLPDNGVSLLGLASDLGVKFNKGRTGAAEGPVALRRALSNMAWHLDTPLYDAGDIHVEDDLAAGQEEYAHRAQQLLSDNQFVVGLGGGHELGWAGYRGLRLWLEEEHPEKRLGILNLDAHFDVRKPAPNNSSGTPFRQAAEDSARLGREFNYACIGVSQPFNTRSLFQFADQQGAVYLEDLDCQHSIPDQFLLNWLEGIDVLYLTTCLDVLPASTAPGVSAPAALGVPLSVLLDMIRRLETLCRQSDVEWKMADIAELNPSLDLDQRTAKSAARMVHEILRSKFGSESLSKA